MAKVAILSYIKRKSLVHELTGTTKLIFFITWSVASMVTYDTRILLGMLIISVIIFKISKIRVRDISIVLGLAAVFWCSTIYLCICLLRNMGWNCMKAGMCS